MYFNKCLMMIFLLLKMGLFCVFLVLRQLGSFGFVLPSVVRGSLLLVTGIKGVSMILLGLKLGSFVIFLFHRPH